MITRILLIVAAIGLAETKAQAGDRSIEFNSDPTQEDYERIIKPLANPIRQSVASGPSIEGGEHNTFSTAIATSTVPEEADTLSKSYVGSDGVGRSMTMTRFNLYTHSANAGKAGQNFHSGFMLTAGFFPYSNQQLIGGSLIAGSDIAAIRFGYATLYGANEFAACSANAEAVVRLFAVPRIMTLYGGAGVANTGASAWWLGMSEKKTFVWYDRYAMLGANLPLGSLLSGTDYAPFSAGGEIQYSTSPKQTTVALRAALNF